MIGTRWLKVYHDLFDNKSRLVLTVLSIAVGVIAFGGMFTIRRTVLDNLTTQFVATHPVDITFTLRPFGDDLVRWAAAQDGVLRAQGVSLYSVHVLDNGKGRDVALHAYSDYANAEINRLQAVEGTFPIQPGDVMIERSYLQQANWAIGDTLQIVVTSADGKEKTYPLRLVGTLHDLSVRSGNANTQLQLYVDPRTLSRLDLSSDYNLLYLNVNRPWLEALRLPLTTVSQDIRDKLAQRGITVLGVDVKNPVKFWAMDAVNGLSALLVMVGFVSLVLSGFLVVNTVNALMAQQRRYIGIMKIIGASRGQVTALYLALIGAYSVMALVIAIPGSLALAYVIATSVSGQINVDILRFDIPWDIIGFEIVAAILIPLGAAIGPILSGTKLSAAQAISDRAGSSRANPIDVLLARIQGLPRPMLLALRGVFRRKLRLAVTLTTLIIAGAFFLAILNVQKALPNEIRGFFRMSNFNVEVVFDGSYDSDGVLRRALATPGVIAGEMWPGPSVSRVSDSRLQNKEFVFYGVPADSIFVSPNVVAGRWLAPETSDNRHEIVVSDELLKTEKDVRVGSTVKLNYRGKIQEWHVVGVVDTDELLGVSPAYGYTDSVADFIGAPHQANWLLLHTQEQTLAAEQTIANQLKQIYQDQGMAVQRTILQEEVVQNALSAFQTVVSLLLVTAILIAAVGGLGLASTMSLSVMERTREIGVMRSIGAATNTLRLMFVAEGVIVGLISFVAAVLLSIPTSYGFSYVLGTAMFSRPIAILVNDLAPFYWLLIILLVSTAASLLPARRASEISIREALTYE